MKIIEETDTPFYTIDSVFLVTPSYKIENGQFTMSLELEKKKESEEYYFPSSEELRLIIKDGESNEILNTGGAGKNFLAVINPVEPKLLGEKRVYAYTLNGITLFENGDEIKIYMILPVKPNEISYQKIITLKK